MFHKFIDFKVLLIFVIIISQTLGFKSNYATSCKQRKPYAFCGAKTVAGTQWYFDIRKDKCMPYKYCIKAGELDVPNATMENRFGSEIQCEFICHKRRYDKESETLAEKLNKLLLKRLKKTVSRHYQQRNSLQVQSFSQFEANDPSRCKRQKSYSYCGSRTTTHVHWHYNKVQNRCQPFAYCEVVANTPVMNTENNFYSENECNKLCVN